MQFAGTKPNHQERWPFFQRWKFAGFASLVRFPLTPHALNFQRGLRSVLVKALRGRLYAQGPWSHLLHGWLASITFFEKFCKSFNFNPVHRLTELEASVSLVED